MDYKKVLYSLKPYAKLYNLLYDRSYKHIPSISGQQIILDFKFYTYQQANQMQRRELTSTKRQIEKSLASRQKTLSQYMENGVISTTLPTALAAKATKYVTAIANLGKQLLLIEEQLKELELKSNQMLLSLQAEDKDWQYNERPHTFYLLREWKDDLEFINKILKVLRQPKVPIPDLVGIQLLQDSRVRVMTLLEPYNRLTSLLIKHLNQYISESKLKILEEEIDTLIAKLDIRSVPYELWGRPYFAAANDDLTKQFCKALAVIYEFLP